MKLTLFHVPVRYRVLFRFTRHATAIKHNNVVIFDDRGIPSIMVRFENPRAAVTPVPWGNVPFFRLSFNRYSHSVAVIKCHPSPFVRQAAKASSKVISVVGSTIGRLVD